MEKQMQRETVRKYFVTFKNCAGKKLKKKTVIEIEITFRFFGRRSYFRISHLI